MVPAAQLVKVCRPPGLCSSECPVAALCAGSVIALIVEFLPAAPKIVPMPVLGAQALPAHPCGTASAPAPAALQLQYSLAAEKDFLKHH